MRLTLTHEAANNLINDYCYDAPSEDAVRNLTVSGVVVTEFEPDTAPNGYVRIRDNYYATQTDLDAVLYSVRS